MAGRADDASISLAKRAAGLIGLALLAPVALLAVALLPRAVGTRKPHDQDHAELRPGAADRGPVREPIRFGRDRANVDEPWSWPRDPANPTYGSRADEHAGPRQHNRKA